MKKETIVEILASWNFWEKDLDAGISRKVYLNKLLKFVKTGKIISIVGVRRSGKTTLIKQIAKSLINSGTPRNDTLIINFEEPQFESIDVVFLMEIYKAYLEIINPVGKPFIFLDEVQNVKSWEKFARSLNEKKEAHIVISGSSSKLLSKELASVLTGRQLYFEIFPLTFDEFLTFRGIEVKTKKDRAVKALMIKRILREYMMFGGFPEVVLGEDEEFKRRVLLSYYEDVISRDIVYRFRIKKIDQLKTLVRFFLTNISSPITFSSISKFIKLPVETIRRFSSYIETSFLIFFVKRFSFSVKQQENSARKVYSVDVGLSNYAGFKFSKDAGKIAENLVALELRILQSQNPSIEVYYWKDHQGGKEVDFVIKENIDVKELIQVCWDISDERTRNREERSLLKAMEEFKPNDGIIITEDYEAEEKIKGKKIVFIPLWKWLCRESGP